jgi:hypothetical protein
MNKGRRQELTNLKFKKRLDQLGLKKSDGNMYAFKSHGKPCSCCFCSGVKYKRSEFKVRTKEELEQIRVKGYKLLIP